MTGPATVTSHLRFREYFYGVGASLLPSSSCRDRSSWSVQCPRSRSPSTFVISRSGVRLLSPAPIISMRYMHIQHPLVFFYDTLADTPVCHYTRFPVHQLNLACGCAGQLILQWASPLAVVNDAPGPPFANDSASLNDWWPKICRGNPA